MTSPYPPLGPTGPSSQIKLAEHTSSASSSISVTTSMVVIPASIQGTQRLTPVPANGEMIKKYVREKYSGENTDGALFFDDHLHYEIEMFFLAIVDMRTLTERSAALSAQDPRLTFQYSVNRVIEQVCLHARNLAEFLKENRGGKFGVKAFTNPNFKCVPYAGLPPDLYDKICEQIAHLNPNRTSDEAEKISGKICVEVIFPTLLSGLVAFEACLKDEFRPLWRCTLNEATSEIAVRPRVSA